MIQTSPYHIASRYVGVVYERQGNQDHPFIQWCFSLCGYGFDAHDEIPWCSAFLQHPFWELRLGRSKSAAARSWLTLGQSVALDDAKPDGDVVILKRGLDQPGPEVIQAPGHVGLFSGVEGRQVLILGGNQTNTVSVASFPIERILGIRRLAA